MTVTGVRFCTLESWYAIVRERLSGAGGGCLAGVLFLPLLTLSSPLNLNSWRRGPVYIYMKGSELFEARCCLALRWPSSGAYATLVA